VLADFAGDGSRFAIEIVAEDLFGGPRLAGDFRKAQEKWLGKAAAADGENTNRLVLGGALQNYGIEILYAPRQFRTAAQDFVELLDFLVKRSGALEVQLLAGFFAFFLNGSTHRTAARFQKTHKALDFDVIFLLAAPREAGRQAHLHFGIKAAGERWITADFDLAAPHFEQIEDAFGKS
jgi:hypothetical protein